MSKVQSLIVFIVLSFTLHAQSELIVVMGDDGDKVPSYLTDSDARAWYDASDASTITINEYGVAVWADKSGQGNDLHFHPISPSSVPQYSNGEVVFDGGDDFLLTDVYSLDFPITVYLLVNMDSYSSGDALMDGTTVYNGSLQQAGASPTIRLYSGGNVITTTDLPLDTYGIITILWIASPDNSSLQINRETAVTGNVGTNTAPDGTVLGAFADGSAPSNIKVKQLIIRVGSDSQETQDAIYNYLLTKI